MRQRYWSKRMSDFPVVKGQCNFCNGPLPKRHRRWCSRECESNFILVNIEPTAKDWNIIRRQMIEAMPYCVKCGSKTKLNVDHIRPIALGGDEFDKKNLQVLCHECHRKKTREDVRIMRDFKRAERAKVHPIAYNRTGRVGP